MVIYLEGGADSFNMVVPHSGCAGNDLFAEYETTRGVDGTERRALLKSDLLPIDVTSSAQPCTTFGLHPELGTLKQLFDDGDAAVLANVGALVEPITYTEYVDHTRTKRLPPGLFGHNTMQDDMYVSFGFAL